MKSCPNRNLKEWKDLVKAIGQFEAMRDFMEYGDRIRSIDEIRAEKPELFVTIASTIYELKPDITENEIKTIYDNYVALMNRVREGKAIPYDSFKIVLKSYQVYNYKDTYIFGQYDSKTSTFITRLNSSPTSKELLAEAIPNIVNKGMDFISFVPKDYADKLVRSGYTSSLNSFSYNFKGEKMQKFAVASSPDVFNKIFGKNYNEISGKEIEDYSEGKNLSYVPVEIKQDLIQKAGDDLSKILETYLNQFGIVVKDINDIKDKLGIDEIGFADILSKVAYVKDKTDLPPIAGEFIAYMMQHNSLVKDIIVDLSKTDNYKGLDKSKYFKIIGNLISEDLQNKLEGNYNKSLVEKIKKLIKMFFDLILNVHIDKININVGIITNNILQQNKKLITSSLYKPGAFGKPIEQVSIEEALKKDRFGSNIIYKLSKLGFILTGSTALSEQGVILRPDENPLHDIDWVSPFSRQETTEKFLKVYPDAIKVREILGGGATTDSYLIAPEGYSIQNYKSDDFGGKILINSYDVVDSDGKVVGNYQLVKNEATNKLEEVTTGIEAKVIDFFTYEDYSSKNKFEPFSYQSKEGTVINLSNWKDIFAAKLEWARYKDIWDYNRFIPYENFPITIKTTIKPGVEELFESNPELASIGTEEQYSQYLDTIFPDSKVKDIVYHVNKTGIISSEDGRKFYSTSSGSWLEELEEMKGTRIPIILNITNPTIVDSYYEFTDKAEKFRESGLGNEYVTPDEVRESGTDSVIGRDSGQGGNEKTYVTYSSNQVYQLGSKQDIEGFKNFVSRETGKPSISFYRQLAESQSQYSVIDRPIIINVEQNKKLKGQEILRKLINKLEDQIGIKANIITTEDALSLLSEYGIDYDNEPGFFFNGEVYFIQDKITSELVLHEFAHPLLKAMRKSNPQLFEKLYNELENTEEGREIIAFVKDRYANEFKEGTDDFKEEVIVRALSKSADAKLNNKQLSTGFMAWIKELLYNIKQFFRRLFTGEKIKIESLKVDTTLNELADMLLSESFKIDTEMISEQDAAQFSKEIREQLAKDINRINTSVTRQLVTTMTRKTVAQMEKIQNINAKDLRNVLQDNLGRPDLAEIVNNLKPFNVAAEPIFTDPIAEFNYLQKRAEALVNSMLRLEMISERMLEHFKRISKDVTKENLAKAYYYTSLIKEWEGFAREFLRQTRQELENGNLTAKDEIVQLTNRIIENFERTIVYRDSIQMAGTEELLTNQLQGMMNNINEYYENLIDYKTKKGAPQRELNRLKQEYELVKLDPKKISDLLRGDLGDAHPLNSWLESYMYNQDPAIFGFAQYVTDNFMDMHAEIQAEFNKFINELDPLLDKAGYKTALQRLTLGKDMAMEDSRRIDAEGNDKNVLVFLTPYKNYITKMERLEKKAAEAKAKVNTDATNEAKQELAEALKAVREERNQFWHQPFTAEYYERYKLFETPVGQLAYAAQQEILNKIQGLNTAITDFEELIFVRSQEELYWREYQALANETYSDGTPKVDSPEDGVYDLSIAKVLQQFRAETKKFYEWKPKSGLFNTEYIKFLQSIEKIDQNSPEYHEKMKKFLEENTVVALSDEYYNDLAKIFAKLRELSKSEQDLKIVQLYEERSALLSGNRDENRQPIGNQMNQNVLQRLNEIEKEITELRKQKVGSSGLTGYELDTYLSLKAQVEESEYYGGEELSEDNARLYLDLDAKYQAAKEKGLSDNDMEIRIALNDLKNMQKRLVSSYYIDTINNMVTPEMREIMMSDLMIKDFDSYSQGILENVEFVDKLKEASPEFASWHQMNHTLVEYKSKGKVFRSYKPSSAWTYTVPTNPKHYKSTVIYDSDGLTVVDTIPRVPNKSYFYRAVRKEVNGKSIITPRRTYLDCINEGLPLEEATIDMQGNFLPRADVANSPYRNEKYYELSKNKDKYKVLLALLKNHLSYQLTLPYDSRLDIETPRFRKENLEIIAGRKEKANPITAWFKNLKSYFASAPDDQEDNLNPAQELMMVNADLYDTDYTKIPINGIYDLEIVETSEDVLRGVMRYMQSAKRQKKLLEILPYAKAVQNVVNDPDNQPDVIGQTMLNMKKTMLSAASRFIPGNKENKSVRAAAINAFIEREFEGKTQSGMLAQYSGAQKIADGMMKISSFAFFAFNIPSGLKNAWGARFQSMIEASAGKHFGWTQYGLGSAWATKVTFEISHQIYKKESRSVDVQLVELMDPSQGRLNQGIREGVGTTRSALTDLTDSFKYGTNIRKWTELNATLSVFGAMLKSTKIKRTLSNGQEQTITYDEAWEVVDGVIQLKDGIDKKWDKGGSEYKNFVRKTRGVINNLNGAMTSFDQPGAGRWLLYRFVMYIKTYFTRMLMHRFQARLKGNMFTGQYLPRYDAYTNDIALGFYIEGMRALFDIIKSKGAGIKSMHPDELRSLRRMLTESGLLVLINMLIVNLLFGFDEDDDEKYEKIRKRSGALPLPFVEADPDRPFNPGGYLANHLLSLSMQISAENEAWLPIPGLGADEYVGILSLEAVPIAATVKKYADLLDKLSDLVITRNKSAYYQRDMGPYNWQKKESAKIINYALKSIGVTGKNVDPATQIETTVKLRNADILSQ